MTRTIKRSIIITTTLITMLTISFTSIGCSNACGPTTAEIENLKPMVSSIVIGYGNGQTLNLTPQSADFDDICDEAIRIALSINIHFSGLQTVEQLYEARQKFVYVSFAQPVDITTCIIVSEEERDHITTNEDGYRIITPSELVILSHGTLLEIRAGCETWGGDTLCAMWGSTRSMGKLNSLIDDLR